MVSCGLHNRLRLQQGRLAGRAPVHRLFGANNSPGQEKLVEFPRNSGLVLEIHSQVPVVPIAQHAEALELLALRFYPFLGIAATGSALAEHRGSTVSSLPVPDPHCAQWAVHGSPTGNIGDIETAHALGTKTSQSGYSEGWRSATYS